MIGRYLVLSSLMFALGTYGVIARRNLLIILMSVELMLNGVNIAILSFARLHAASSGASAQVFVLMVMGVAAAEVSVGLAILIAVFRVKKTVDTGDLRSMKG